MNDDVTTQLKNVSKLYDGWAEHYDADCISIPAYAHLDSVYNGILDKYAGQLGHSTTIELGCGTGIHTSILARMNANVIAIDISSQCLSVAKRKIRSTGLKHRVQFVKCDAMHLPFKDNVANSVVSLGLLTCHTDGCSEIVAEISRILHHRGHFILDVQNKYSLNTLYYLADALTKGRFLKLGFSSMKDFREYLRNGKISWIYRGKENNTKTKIPFSTFSVEELRKMLMDNNLVQKEVYGAHLFTLLMPLEYQETRLPRSTSSALLFLGKLDKSVRAILARLSSVVIVTGFESEKPLGK